MAEEEQSLIDMFEDYENGTNQNIPQMYNQYENYNLNDFYDKLGSLGLTGAYAGGAGDVPLGVEKSAR